MLINLSRSLIVCYSCYLEKGREFLLKAAWSSLLSLHIEDCGIFYYGQVNETDDVAVCVQNLRPLLISEIYVREFVASK